MAGGAHLEAAPLLAAGGRTWTLPDEAADVSSAAAGSRAAWSADGVVLELAVRHQPGAAMLEVVATLPAGLTVADLGVRLRHEPRPSRILVDGYHSWDWAGVRDATRPGRGWWSALWGDAAGGVVAPVHVAVAATPRRGAIAIRWDSGLLDAVTVGEPLQDAQRTGPPQPLESRAVTRRRVSAEPIAVASLDAAVPTRAVELPSGWLSWNCLGEAVTARAVLDAAGELAPPGGMALVDDGWMGAWGDWAAHDRFGATVEELAVALKASNRRLGVWLAPFHVAPSSQAAAAHPEWLLCGADGVPLLDTRPSLPHHVLDAARDDVRAGLADLGRRMGRAGVALLKIDFLYGGALPGLRTGTTPTAALRDGLAALTGAYREAAPTGAVVIGCGAPGPVVAGLADACRSGGDAVINVPNRGAEPPPRPWFAHGLAVLRAQARNLAARSWLWGPALPADPDAVTLGPVGDMPPLPHALAAAWVELVRRADGPRLVADIPGALGDDARALLARLHAGPPARGEPERPADPLGMAPLDAAEDAFYGWPESLPPGWDPAS